MGKKGRELRQQKEAAAKYTFTMEQLRERDRQTIERFRQEITEDCRQKLEAEAERRQKLLDEYLEKEWKEREALVTDQTPLSDLMMMLLSLSTRVLIEKFHWKPIPENGVFDGRNKTAQFAKYLSEELNKITDDEMMDIRRYCEETYEMYGIKYISYLEKEEENNHDTEH